MFRLRQKVKIISSKKTDGRYNYGKIVGIELLQNGSYLGYKSPNEFFARFDGKLVRYTVAYIDCFTERACVEEFTGNELQHPTTKGGEDE